MEVVGKGGWVRGEESEISKNPELHRRVLENFNLSEIAEGSMVGYVFHFCVGTYGDY